MRVIVTSALVLVLLVVGVHTLAQGEDGASDETRDLKLRAQLLELQVQYLLSREAAVSDYLLAGGDRAADLANSLEVSRAQGFTMAAFAQPSREALLKGLEDAAAAAQEDLPAVSKDEATMLKEIQRLSKLKKR